MDDGRIVVMFERTNTAAMERAALLHTKITTHMGRQRDLDEQLLIRKVVLLIGSEVNKKAENEGLYVVDLEGNVLHYLGHGEEVIRNVEALISANAPAFKFITSIDWSSFKETLKKEKRYLSMKKIAYGILGEAVAETRVNVLPMKSDTEVEVELGATMKDLGLRQNDIVCYNPVTLKVAFDEPTNGIALFS